ncbi:type II toxin-antitoxin system VapC family toxin [Priestia flexa]|nr:type II toxin-antitoxin system VapC family toxin [Priestia flexa]
MSSRGGKIIVVNKSSIFLIKNNDDKIVYPRKAFLDTNVALDLYLNREHKNAWLQFMFNATTHGTEFVFDLHTLREVRNVLNYQVHDKKAEELGIEKRGRTPRWKVLENNPRYNFSEEVSNQTMEVETILRQAGVTFAEVINGYSMYKLENLYASTYDLGPGDAAIAATMDSLEINSICTNDSGFFKTDDFNVYSPTDRAFKASQKRSNKVKKFKSILDKK